MSHNGTLLDPEETTPPLLATHLPPAPPRPPNADLPSTTVDRSCEDLCLTFRHSGWRRRRELIHAALRRRYAGSSRLEHFQNCGSNAWLCRSTEIPPRYRIKTNKCRDRFCDPCAREKRNLVAQNVARNLPSQPLRFLTLTIKSSDHDLSTCITKLLSSWQKLRTRRVISRCIQGGLYFLEITLNDETQQWHPHLHAILQGSYLPIDLVRDSWHRITKDSYICNIQWIRNPVHAVGYITKYASKSIPAKVCTNPGKLQEAMIALAGLRTFNTFGSWRNMDLSRCPADDTEWIEVGPLWLVINNALAGDPEARHILDVLHFCDLDPIQTESSAREPPRGDAEDLRKGCPGVSQRDFMGND